MSKTVLITGIRGLIARSLKEKFEKEGYAVIGTDRQDSPKIAELLESAKPGLIIHVAAELDKIDEMFTSNVVLTYEILEYCRKHAPICRLIHIGSSSEYGLKTTATRETDTLEPNTIYEGTKAAASMLVRSYAMTYKFMAAIVRPYSIYGPGQKQNKLIPKLLERPDSFKLCPDPVHDYVYVDDFADAVFKVVEKQKKLFDVVNVGSGKQISNLQVLETVEKVLDHKYCIEMAEAKVNDTFTWVCDPRYLEKEYGFRATISLEEGIARMVKSVALLKNA